MTEKVVFDLCRECKKVIQQRKPGIGQAVPSYHFEDGEWKDENAYQRSQRIRPHEDNCCSDECGEKAKSKRKKEICERCKQPSSEPLHWIENGRTGKSWMACYQCLHFCQLCKKNHHEFITNENNEKWEPDMLLCRECSDKLPGNKKSKPVDKNEIRCERCGISCWDPKENCYYRLRITWHTVNFNEEVHYFSHKCSCAEQFKKNHQQTCPQCHKINSLLERENESSWPTIWHEWEKNNFCWPIEQIIPERVRKID